MFWIEKDPLFALEYKMSKFCNAFGCEGHTKPVRLVEAKFPKRFFYIFDRQELEEWFLCICTGNKLLCGSCEDCYTCSRFYFIKEEIHKLGYFVRRNWPWQPILWQVHEKYFLNKQCESKTNFGIERLIKVNF